jgi:4-hydroxy-tetrahydrodipicolinate synthase
VTFRGSIPALITPMKNGRVDEAAFRKFIAWQIAEGSHGIVPVGTTGESPTLSEAEHKQVIEVAIDEAKGKVPVIAGTGSNNTEEALEYTRHAKKAGADAALIVVPYYNRPTQDGLYAHFKTIADAVDIPIFIYNVPGRTVTNITVETLARLAKDCRNIIGTKDASADLARPSRQRLARAPTSSSSRARTEPRLPSMRMAARAAYLSRLMLRRDSVLSFRTQHCLATTPRRLHCRTG